MRKMNAGTLSSIRRGRERREQHRTLIRSLPNYRVGFTRHDIKLDVSVARRELREMVDEGILTTTKLVDGTLVYKAGPENLLKMRWRVDDSIYHELEEALHDL